MEQVHDLRNRLRAVRLHGVSAAKPRLYRAIEAVAGTNPATSSLVVELGFVSLPPQFSQLTLQACVRPAASGVRVSLLTLCLRALEPDTERVSAIACRALEEFGGTRFTGLEAARSGSVRRTRAADGLDASVVFPSEFPFFARNTVFVPRLRSIAETETYADLLQALGVEHTVDGGMLRVAHTQWRMPMRVEGQLRAFEGAVRAGFRTAIYSARLPVMSSTRLELGPPRLRELECIVSCGLASNAGCNADDLERMESFVAEQFGIELAALSYKLRVSRGFSPHDMRWANPAVQGRRVRRR